jgi:hypothetical protein
MPAEDAFFIGEETATATRLRQTRLQHQLGQGPGAWLATVFAVLLGKRLPGAPAQAPEASKFARGFLRGLGYDPDTHQLSRRRRPFPGFVVRGPQGEAVRFLRERELKALVEDPNFMAEYQEEVEA